MAIPIVDNDVGRIKESPVPSTKNNNASNQKDAKTGSDRISKSLNTVPAGRKTPNAKQLTRIMTHDTPVRIKIFALNFCTISSVRVIGWA